MALVAAATLFPRLCLLGGYPATDEGIFAFAAQQMHASLRDGHGLPDFWPLMSYPILVSWVFALDLNHLLMLRFVDMAVALCAAWLLYRVAAKESGSIAAGAVITAVFVFAMNQPAFIQNGFKNSMFAAYVPLLAAARLGLFATAGNRARWWACGSLVAFAIVLRETFIPFAVIGGIAILLGHGPRELLRYAVGGILTGSALIGAILLLRGGSGELLASYTVAGQLYSALDHMRWSNLAGAFSTALREAAPAIPFALGGLAAIALRLRRSATDPPAARWLFWLAVALAPWVEPVMKVGYPYQIAVALLGFCGMAALGWKSLRAISPAASSAVGAVLTVASIVLAWPLFARLDHFFRERTVHNLAAWRGQQWPAASVAKSNYLLLAAAIDRAAPPAGTLAISGSMSALFPLTGLAPSSYRLHNLSETALRLGQDAGAIRNAIRECAPDVVMVTSRTDIPGRDALLAALAGMSEYSEVAVVPVASDKDYGSFGGSIYRNSAPSGCKLAAAKR